MLDNVLDVTYWPLDEQRQEAMAKRRIGLGFTGLGDMLLMIGLDYGSKEARDLAGKITSRMRNEAYKASIELAKEKGPFPLFDAEQYLRSPFVQRLPEAIRERIAKHGIRNSHLLSIAPTGTVSLAFGDNCSSGIEPVFEWVGSRSVKQPDGSWKTYKVEDHAFRCYRAHRGWEERPDEDVIAELPGHWVRAMDLNPEQHLAMVAAVAPYIDTSISKTINVPTDYPYERFKGIYRTAYRRGLKGVTTFRPSGLVESVLHTRDSETSTGADGADAHPEDLDLSDPDRRLTVDAVPAVALASLRWTRRPSLPDGNPAWCYLVDHPHGHRFAVFVGHIENGQDYPFEVWVNGADQPRGLGALAKSLSMDMRCNDRAFLKAKLESLCRAASDDRFDLVLPGKEQPVPMPSLVAGFAHLVKLRCEQLGTFEQEGPTPVMDALLFQKEPKTGTEGTMSWTVDVRNDTTGDDFVLGLKELTLPNGQRRPYSLWLAGEYPRPLDGLCKLLSWDMRVADVGWIGAKLRQLLDFAELRGDFWARMPGRERSMLYPSTVAYVAQLVIHRFAMLGILDEEGYPIEASGLVTVDEGEDDTSRTLRAVGAVENRVYAGARCEQCGTYAVIRRDGCEFCTACGATGSCG